jgi:hypothetical protein
MKNNKEIGGYLELERYSGSLYHDEAVPLNCGRGCLSYLIELRDIKEIWLPDYLCESVEEQCAVDQVNVKRYAVNRSFQPNWETITADEGFLYLVDYFGLLREETIDYALELFSDRLIVDETQGFFRLPRPQVDTLYTTRKYFGVPDGGFVYVDRLLERRLEKDESRTRMNYLLGRFERTASEFFSEAQENNEAVSVGYAREMSLITKNLLRSLDYDGIIARRESNYRFLERYLSQHNSLEIEMPIGPFAYPFLVKDGPSARALMAAQKIYIPTLWPNVVVDLEVGEIAKEYATNILPLPVDQRYDKEDMRLIVDTMFAEGIIR